MRILALAMLVLCAPGVAVAAPVKVADDAPYAVAVETLATAKAQGKKGLMWEGFSAGGYDLYTKLTATGRAGGFMLSKAKYKVSVEYRFARSDQTPLLNGACQISSETQTSYFGFVSETTSGGLYGCAIEGKAAADYALEVSQSPLSETSLNGKSSDGLSVSVAVDKGDPGFDRVKAKMVYKGIAYEAIPTSYDVSRTISRIIDGFVILRDGKPVGRIDFSGNNRDKASFTVPVAEADGREAVIFFTAQLLAMPDINAGYVRSLLHLE